MAQACLVSGDTCLIIGDFWKRYKSMGYSGVVTLGLIGFGWEVWGLRGLQTLLARKCSIKSIVTETEGLGKRSAMATK